MPRDIAAGVPSDDAVLPLHERVDLLFAEFVKPDDPGRPRRSGKPRRYTNADFANYVTKTTGRSLTDKYVGMLRNGAVPNPTLAVLKALGSFFGVTMQYFDDNESFARIRHQIQVAKILRADATLLAAYEDLVAALREHAARLTFDDIQLITTLISEPGVLDRARELLWIAAAYKRDDVTRAHEIVNAYLSGGMPQPSNPHQEDDDASTSGPSR